MTSSLRGRPFQPGVSGNPGGRPKSLTPLRELARAHAAAAIEELARLAVHMPKTKPRALRQFANYWIGVSANPPNI